MLTPMCVTHPHLDFRMGVAVWSSSENVSVGRSRDICRQHQGKTFLNLIVPVPPNNLSQLYPTRCFHGLAHVDRRHAEALHEKLSFHFSVANYSAQFRRILELPKRQGMKSILTSWVGSCVSIQLSLAFSLFYETLLLTRKLYGSYQCSIEVNSDPFKLFDSLLCHNEFHVEYLELAEMKA